MYTYFFSFWCHKIRQLILQVSDDPDNVTRIRTALLESSRDLICLCETHQNLLESLSELHTPPLPPTAQALLRLYEGSSKGLVRPY